MTALPNLLPTLSCRDQLGCGDPNPGGAAGIKKQTHRDRKQRLLPRHDTMHLLGPWLLLLEHLAFSASSNWRLEHPEALYAWEGACVWVPCIYRIPDSGDALKRFTLFHNPEYNDKTKSFEGTRLYENKEDGRFPSEQRVQFLGHNKNNCTLRINPVYVNDSGPLGLRMESQKSKWMGRTHLSVSERPFPPHIQLPPEIQESQEITLTCLLNFSCHGYQIRLQWFLEGDSMAQAVVTPTSVVPESVFTWSKVPESLFTRSELKFKAQWSHHGKNVTCQLRDAEGKVLSEDTVQLNVKHPPKEVTTVIQNPTAIREGDTVTLSCNYNSSNPGVTWYEWKTGSTQESSSSGVLKIQNIAWNNNVVSCAACNHWCSWASQVTLNVQYAPRGVWVRRVKPPSEIYSGNSVSLQCGFTSSHPKEVQFFWKKNGKLLGEESELNFDSISPEDTGSYSCWVKNSIGQTASEPCTLQVLYAPRRLRVSMSPGNRVMEGRRAALTCESDANPPVSYYTWFDRNNRTFHYPGQTLRLEPVEVEHSGAYWCRGTNSVGEGYSPLSTLTVYYSPETIGRQVALFLGSCLAILILGICGFKLQQRWERTQSQQGLQENSSGQSFFVRNKKVRRVPLSEGPHSLGCYNPMMEDVISYATLQFPEMDTPRTGDAGTSEIQRPAPDRNDSVIYSVLQKRQADDYENVVPDFPEDEGIHYSELIRFGVGERPQALENVDYVILKH
ncbi:B-cell receptor CD22 isoform X4 [Cebus imitator]|uniref:B-cell receptor CD22 isoform X4 n=1 Tax=Cebus imitator TaxID=2715852 RepID=UPI00189936F3|nr:B-cell receptor CD22 isoform X4 [Cebus imitator]